MAEMSEKKEMTIEEAFAELEVILQKLGNGEGDLEQAFAGYQEGLSLIRFLNAKIDGIEKQLQILEAGEEA